MARDFAEIMRDLHHSVVWFAIMRDLPMICNLTKRRTFKVQRFKRGSINHIELKARHYFLYLDSAHSTFAVTCTAGSLLLISIYQFVGYLMGKWLDCRRKLDCTHHCPKQTSPDKWMTASTVNKSTKKIFVSCALSVTTKSGKECCAEGNWNIILWKISLHVHQSGATAALISSRSGWNLGAISGRKFPLGTE